MNDGLTIEQDKQVLQRQVLVLVRIIVAAGAAGAAGAADRSSGAAEAAAGVIQSVPECPECPDSGLYLERLPDLSALWIPGGEF